MRVTTSKLVAVASATSFNAFCHMSNLHVNLIAAAKVLQRLAHDFQRVFYAYEYLDL